MAEDLGNTKDHGACGKVRLDRLLVDRGLAESREQAQRLIMAGQVRVVGLDRVKPGIRVASDADLTVAQSDRYVSRGALKLEAGLAAFGLDVNGRICADVGASTGGFTDCLLQAGAARVYAIDVGRGQLHQKLRQDTRVVLVGDTNARDITSATLPEKVGLVCVDLSFISLRLILPVLPAIAAAGCDYVVLVKPQFEATPAEVSRGKGIVTDSATHRRVLTTIFSSASDGALVVTGLVPCPLPGRSGNREYLMHLRARQSERTSPVIDVDGVVSHALSMESSHCTLH